MNRYLNTEAVPNKAIVIVLLLLSALWQVVPSEFLLVDSAPDLRLLQASLFMPPT